MSQSLQAHASDRAGLAYDPKPAGALLAQALARGEQLPPLAEAIRPGTLAEGYEVQDAFVAAVGDKVGGWKLGVGSVNARRAAKIDKALIGQLFASRIHAQGGTVVLSGTSSYTVEFEVAFYLNRDIAPDSVVVDVRDVIASTHVTFEFVHSRFAERRSVGLPSFVGDSVGFGALIVGDAIDGARVDELVRGATVHVNGEERAGGLFGDDIADPWASLELLIEHARARGEILRKGQIVSTGAIAKPFDTDERGVEIEARYLGSSLRVTVA
jgi:2-keto-4-pentenoate hydratase